MSLIIPFFFLSNKLNAFTVVIDPGHGGVDVGAIRDFFKESEITLQIAKKIKEQIAKKLQAQLAVNKINDLDILLTREKNTSLSLENRVQFAKDHKANLFISLHANSSTANYVQGMEFYFKKGQSTNTIPDLKMAIEDPKIKKIVTELVQFGQLRESLKFNQILQSDFKTTTAKTTFNANDDDKSQPRTVIKRAPFYVIEKTPMPSVLIEVGYISNISEAKLLMTDQRQEQIAQTIANSIISYQKNSQRKQ